ncbi:MAG: tetratricopeptide repeat protein [Cytophagales bacterium]|nr:tetratricopeptide repeat protein [Cytophagales bacterium]
MGTFRRLSLYMGFFFFSLPIKSQNREIDSLTRALKQATREVDKVNVLNERAFSYIHQDPTRAMADVKKALQLAKALSFEPGIARSLNVLGGIYWGQGEYDQALNSYFSSLKEYQSLKDDVGLVKCYNNLGLIYYELRDYKPALEYLKKAQQRAEQISRPLTIYINLSQLFVSLDQVDSAEFYINEAFEHPQISQLPRHHGLAYSGRAEIDIKRENYTQALKHATLALREFRHSLEKRSMATVYLQLGTIHFLLDHPDSSTFYYQEALELASSIKARDLQIRIYESMSDIFLQHDDLQSSLRYFKDYAALKDTMFNEQRASLIARLHTEYETDLLIKENENAEAKIRNRNAVIIVTIVLLLVSLVLAYGLYKQKMAERKLNKLLKVKTDQIARQNVMIKSQSKELKALNGSLQELNNGLEEKVRSSTMLLQQKNKILADYAYASAHELRGPVACVLGLSNILQSSTLEANEREVVEHLKKATDELDHVMRSLRERLESEEQL